MSNLKESRRWVEYYEANARNLMEIPWAPAHELAPREAEAILASIQGFQLGESSEGRHLYRLVESYAERTGDVDYLRAVILFIKEEQRHARDLGAFMDQEGLPRIGRTWPDSVFRWLRHLSGLELSITVLLTAEIIAQVYYAALQRATGSRVLRTLCEQILQDEEKHVEFQAERLGMLRWRRAAPALAATEALQRVLFAGTCCVVWWKHGRALRAGGRSLASFWRESWEAFNRAAGVSRGTRASLEAAARYAPRRVRESAD